MNIFKYLSYVKYFSDACDLNKKTYGYKTRLAKAAQCQPALISQVLRDKGHFTIEQAISIADFWSLPERPKDYWLVLVQYARAGTSRLRTHWLNKIKMMQREQENLAKRFEKIEVLENQDAAIYYSGWQYLAFHYALSISKFQTPKALSERFHTSEAFTLKTLQVLFEMGLIQNEGGRWKMKGQSIHLPRISPFTGVNHGNWRTRAVQNAFQDDSAAVHYTSVGSVSLKDAETLKEMMLAFIDQARKTMAESREEELFCISCDWFQV